MDQLATYIEIHLLWIIMVFSTIQLLLIGVLISQRSAIKRLQTRQKNLFRGMDGSNLEEILSSHLKRTEQVADQMIKVEQENKDINSTLNNCIQKVGLVRFSAFNDVGSDLSFSAAILDNSGNGIVISSLYGREESRSYAKSIENYKSKYQLSEEEIKAIAIAKDK